MEIVPDTLETRIEVNYDGVEEDGEVGLHEGSRNPLFIEIT